MSCYGIGRCRGFKDSYSLTICNKRKFVYNSHVLGLEGVAILGVIIFSMTVLGNLFTIVSSRDYKLL